MAAVAATNPPTQLKLFLILITEWEDTPLTTNDDAPPALHHHQVAPAPAPVPAPTPRSIGAGTTNTPTQPPALVLALPHHGEAGAHAPPLRNKPEPQLSSPTTHLQNQEGAETAIVFALSQ